MQEPYIRIENLQVENKHTPSPPILKGINLALHKGKITGLIGESGSGKSMTAKTLMNLLPPHFHISAGNIYFDNLVLKSSPRKKQEKRSHHKFAIIFQDYRGSFTPYIKIGKQMIETIQCHQRISKQEAKSIAYDMLTEMNLPAEQVFKSYSFQLSGGQVQRAAIAMAMTLKPSLLICDEITSSLDVISAEIVMKSLEKIRQEQNCAILLITHDLILALKWTEQVYVMSQGEIVEGGSSKQVFHSPSHDYTKLLIHSIPPLLPFEKQVDAEESLSL